MTTELLLHRDKRLEKSLKKIYDLEVALEVGHKSKKQLLDFLLNNLKHYCLSKCPTFAKYFRHFYLTGSYFEGLKVKEANEFDVNLAFDFPLYQNEYMVDELYMLPSFATVKLKSITDVEDVPFFDAEGYILKNKLSQWFQSLVDSFLDTNDLHYPGVITFKSSNSGPARTIKVLYHSGWISIDLVPVFYLNMEQLDRFGMHTFCHETEDVSACYVVPKPLTPELVYFVPYHNPEHVWRIHFPEAEKIFLKDKKKLKRIIKLMKALRDKQDWPLPSYFLKVVALWLVKDRPENEFWSKHSLDTLFHLFLGALEKHLADQYLGHIFYPRFNLFSRLPKTALNNLHARVRKIVLQLREQPYSVFNFFKVSHCHCSSLVPPLIQY